MDTNGILHGFQLISRDAVDEISANINIFEHIKSGARLCFIEREDRNLSFAISFSTPPEDDTGVFHIIEHSVLCGSRKFPVKEPFVEMLKGSLNTFLNAMTYEDKTVYPVASRCEKDFYNLIDVYLDAVFHPLMLIDERIFMQEGWHLEPCEGGVCYNGVVFSEMSGAYSSPDEIAAAEISRSLFAGSIYGCDSGGRPDAIPDLTYEQFKAAHEKYYIPENSLMVLDGSVDLDKTLALIDSYLSEYERCGFYVETVYPEATVAPRREVCFRAEEGDEKARILYSSVVGRASDKLSAVALTLLCDVLLGTNEAQLKKILLDSGLCEDVSVYMNKAAVNTVTLELHGISPDRISEIDDLLNSSLKGIIDGGIDKRALKATLDRLKFRLREKDLGAFPRGIANALSVLEGWQYGISPRELLTSEDALTELEGYINSSYYEELLCHATLNSSHRASIVMLPSSEGDAVSARISEREAALCESLTEEELERVIGIKSALNERQSTPDSDSAIAAIPTLDLGDIKPYDSDISIEISSFDGANILHHNIETNGILYTELYFSAQNLSNEELTKLSILSSILTNIDTESYTARELKNEIKSRLGSFSALALSYTRVSDGAAIPMFALKLSSLSERADDGLGLVKEVLLKSKYDNSEKLKQVLTQIRSATEDSILSTGDGIATERVESALCESGTVNEELLGLSAYKRIKEYENDFSESGERLMAELEALAKRIFVRERLTVAAAGDAPLGFAEKIVGIFPRGEVISEKSVNFEYKPVRDGVRLPINPSHTAFGFCSPAVSSKLGAFKVAQTILSYEYLWGKIRVIGGAYGAGVVARRFGGVVFSSYRDPAPRDSLEVFRQASDFLREFACSGVSLDKYIIGAVGEYDIIKSPRTEASQASADYLTGWSAEHERSLFEQMLACNKESLLEVADILESLVGNASFTVVGDTQLLSDIDGISIITP